MKKQRVRLLVLSLLVFVVCSVFVAFAATKTSSSSWEEVEDLQVRVSANIEYTDQLVLSDKVSYSFAMQGSDANRLTDMAMWGRLYIEVKGYGRFYGFTYKTLATEDRLLAKAGSCSDSFSFSNNSTSVDYVLGFATNVNTVIQWVRNDYTRGTII